MGVADAEITPLISLCGEVVKMRGRKKKKRGWATWADTGKHREEVRIGEKRVTGRLRGIFVCVCASSRGKRGTVGLNVTQIKTENRSVSG